MPNSFILPSFASGEIAPALYARIDLQKFHTAAKLLRNLFVWAHGGVSNRAGTMFVGRAKDSVHDVQLIPFQFNLVQNYVLEFGHLYMRVIMDGGHVLEPAVSISGVTNANPGVVTAAGHGYSNGDQVFIEGTDTELDSTPGRQYLVTGATTNTFYLTDLDGNDIDTSAYAVYGGSLGTAERVFTLTTPYAGTDVKDIKWTQSNDTLTLCHPDYPPVDLSRTQHWEWALTEISFAPSISPPSGVTFANGGSGAWRYSYVVTAISNSPPNESYASEDAGGTGAILNSNTGVFNTISWTGSASAQMYRIFKANPVYNQAIPDGAMYGYIGTAQGTSFIDTQIAPDFTQTPPQGTNPFNAGPITTVAVLTGGSGYASTITLHVEDVAGTGAVLTPTVTGGVITAVAIESGGQNYQNPEVVVANQGSGAAGHVNVMTVFGVQVVTAKVTSGGQNYYGTVTVQPSAGTGCTFTPTIKNGVITGITVTGVGSGYVDGAALTFTQVSGTGASFSVSTTAAGCFPSCATYFQQRKVFAGSSTSPQTLWMTRPADFHNMDISNPSQANDAIVATIAASQVNAIKWLVPMGDLLIMTSGGAWKLTGGSDTNPVAVTPSNLVVVPQSYSGCGDLPPLVVNSDILYVQSKGSIVRDLSYKFYANLYTGTDMSILSNHLFFGYNLERWAYAEEPFKQLWAVRDDGILLSFTYLKEQDVYAWAHHDSPGNSGTDLFLSVASIPEQQIPGISADSVYFVTQRTIANVNGGLPVKYIERMHSRNFLTNGVADVTKAWFVDCGLQYSGAEATAITGLDHLNGATVSILADGSVQPSQVVTGGAITLQAAASLVTVGLPYVSQLETLSLQPQQTATQTQSFRKKISAVTVRVAETRGLKVGPGFDSLSEMKERSAAVAMGSAISLFTGDESIQVNSRYAVENDICIQQDWPLPCTILGIIPDVSLGDT